ncbi:MAG: hypothetical protein IT209_07760 [Armatimonadetes bacterium]|nr:hypothetical protein [Armatimonadota bacterium]
MKIRFRVAIAVITAAGLTCIGVIKPGTTAQGESNQPVGPVQVSARVIEWLEQDLILTGGTPRVHSLDGRFDFRGGKIVVTLNRGKSVQRKDLVAKVVATGGATVDAKLPDRTVHATASKATYDHASETVVFEGNVKAKVMDPQLTEPGTLVGQKATLWLNAGPGQTRVKVEGAPATIQVTPKGENQERKG